MEQLIRHLNARNNNNNKITTVFMACYKYLAFNITKYVLQSLN